MIMAPGPKAWGRENVPADSWPGSVHLLLLGVDGVLLCPLPGRLDGGLLVLLPRLGDVGSQGVVWVRGAEEGLDGEEDRSDLQGWRPVVCPRCQQGMGIDGTHTWVALGV